MNQPAIRMIGMLLIAAAERMEEADLTFGAVLDGADAELLSQRIAKIDEKLTRNEEHLLSVTDLDALSNTSADAVVDTLRTAVEQ